MPIYEPLIAGGTRGYRLRHIGPKAAIWANPPINLQTVALLNQPTMISRPLPLKDGVPGAADFEQGQWSGRINDAGEAQVVFPNGIATDGIPWRDRFDPEGHNQWIEIYSDSYLEQTFCVVTVTKGMQTIQVAGGDPVFMLKKAFVRDLVVVCAPRDILERGTRLWVPLIVDSFPYTGSSVPSSQWIVDTANTATEYATAGANDPSLPGCGAMAWTNPNNIAGGSPSPAYAVIFGPLQGPASETTQGLKAVAFGFSIPVGATIVGVKVGYETQLSPQGGGAGFTISSSNPQLTIAGAPVASAARSQSGSLFSSLLGAWTYFGSSSDTWGIAGSLTPAVVNATGFGVDVYAVGSVLGTGIAIGTMVLRVIQVSMEIFYTLPGTSVVSVRSTGDLSMSVTSTPGSKALLTSLPFTPDSAIWKASCEVVSLPGSSAQFSFVISENSFDIFTIDFTNNVCIVSVFLSGSGWVVLAQLTVASAASYSFLLESDGEWFWAFINGQFVSGARRPYADPSQMTVALQLLSNGTADTVVVNDVLVEALQPFLMKSDNERPSPVESAGTGTDVVGGGTVAWTNPNNIATPGSLASSITPGAAVTHALWATNFAFNVPANATITGVEVRYLKQNTNAVATNDIDAFVGLVHSGVAYGTNRSLPAPWPTNATWFYYGSPVDLWGAPLTPAIVNDSTFGVQIQGQQTTSAPPSTFNIYNPVVMVVYYTLPGSDSGDFVLPGDQSTYPWGGLHGRYYNDGGLSGFPTIQFANMILHPSRSSAYLGGGGPEYAQRQDATINFTGTNAASNWAYAPGYAVDSVGVNVLFSVKWFGAIYLKLSQGNYTISFTADDAVRVWVGDLDWYAMLIDGTWQTGGGGTFTATISAALLGGKDGWYPIKIEYWQGPGNSTARFSFTPPVSYTDPGGSALTGAAQVIVPSTSLSPLGCIDQRYQGISHFDLTQQTLNATGLQASFEPQRLESGLFPGKLLPRVQEGHATDIILTPDANPRSEPILNYQNVEDASDFVSSMQGNGAGFTNAQSGQLQGLVYDANTLTSSLFDAQGWQDFSDASFASLLDALLSGQLGLRMTPWTVVTGEPRGTERLAMLWPLPAAITQARWRPGDSLRLRARDISLWDVAPRQMLTVQRNFVPLGVTATNVGWANRPRGAVLTQRQLFFVVTRQQRSYQGQYVTLSGTNFDGITVAGSNGVSAYSMVSLSPADHLVRAYVRVAYWSLVNSTTDTFGLDINGVDVTTMLGGPWNAAPITIDITAVANPDQYNRLWAQIINRGASSHTASFQLFVDVHGR